MSLASRGMGPSSRIYGVTMRAWLGGACLEEAQATNSIGGHSQSASVVTIAAGTPDATIG